MSAGQEVGLTFRLEDVRTGQGVRDLRTYLCAPADVPTKQVQVDSDEWVAEVERLQEILQGNGFPVATIRLRLRRTARTHAIEKE